MDGKSYQPNPGIAPMRASRNFSAPFGPSGEASIPDDPLSPFTGGRDMPEDLSCADREAETLCDVLRHRANFQKDVVYCTVLAHRERISVTFGELLDGARHYAAGMRSAGLTPGGSVVIMLPTGVPLLFSFFGALLAGIVPAVIAPPFLFRRMEGFISSRAEMLTGIKPSALITSGAHGKTGQAVKALIKGMNHVLLSEDMEKSGVVRESEMPVSSRQTAMIQFSSGSGGPQKAVALTHANLIANVSAVRAVMGTTAKDVVVSWLPLYHDMGLIGCVCQTLFAGCRLALMSPVAFVASPVSWLRLIHEMAGTISVAPNFAYQLCVDNVPDLAPDELDLSRWRMALNGSEMVTAHTMACFSKKFAPMGFRPETFMPVYGLAEATLAVCFTPPGAGPVIDRINRKRFQSEGIAEPAPSGTKGAAMVSVGKPVPGVTVRIADADGREVEDRVQGNLLVNAPSVMKGYVNDLPATQAVFRNGWLDTGDLAYRVGEYIFVTGRSKDIIIKAGRNYLPEHLEQAVGAVSGIRKTAVAAFGVLSSEKGTEKIVVMAEAQTQKDEKNPNLASACRRAVSEQLELTVDDMVIVRAGTLPKTTSGKIQRPLCRKLYSQMSGMSDEGD